jgi:LCP family protein required for cell wall assembly
MTSLGEPPDDRPIAPDDDQIAIHEQRYDQAGAIEADGFQPAEPAERRDDHRARRELARKTWPLAERSRRSRRSLRTRIIGWVSVVAVVVLAASAMVAYAKYRSVWTSIRRVPVAAADLGKRPARFNSALNILVYGSDSRAGLTRRQQLWLHVGRSEGEDNTDSVMIVHISPGRRGVTVLNIPRDTQVPYYACRPGRAAGQRWPGQQADPAALERINAVLAAGGPGCLWKTTEHVTGIRIDHFIGLGLAGFVKVIDDVGGVRVCVPFRVHIPMSGLRLRAGRHHIGGVQALAFWRTREGIGTGSDLERIQRDQYLLAQVLRGILRSRLLSSPSRMLAVVSDAARSMTTDAGLTSTDMLHIAESLRGVSSQGVQFVTAPNAPYPPDPDEVEFQQPRADALFSAIAHDSRLPPATSGSTPAKTPARAGMLDARPSRVRIEVRNGSGIAGRASRAAAALASRGFAARTAGAARLSYPDSVIEYGSAATLPAVRALRNQLTSVTVRHNFSLAPGTVDLIVGSSFRALTPTPSPGSAHSSGKSVSKLAKSDGGSTGRASCASDTGAFAGPLSPSG